MFPVLEIRDCSAVLTVSKLDNAKDLLPSLLLVICIIPPKWPYLNPLIFFSSPSESIPNNRFVLLYSCINPLMCLFFFHHPMSSINFLISKPHNLANFLKVILLPQYIPAFLPYILRFVSCVLFPLFQFITFCIVFPQTIFLPPISGIPILFSSAPSHEKTPLWPTCPPLLPMYLIQFAIHPSLYLIRTGYDCIKPSYLLNSLPNSSYVPFSTSTI